MRITTILPVYLVLVSIAVGQERLSASDGFAPLIVVDAMPAAATVTPIEPVPTPVAATGDDRDNRIAELTAECVSLRAEVEDVTGRLTGVRDELAAVRVELEAARNARATVSQSVSRWVQATGYPGWEVYGRDAANGSFVYTQMRPVVGASATGSACMPGTACYGRVR